MSPEEAREGVSHDLRQILKVVGAIAALIGSFQTGSLNGGASATRQIEGERVPAAVVVHLGGVIADLEGQLKASQRRKCPAMETER